MDSRQTERQKKKANQNRPDSYRRAIFFRLIRLSFPIALSQLALTFLHLVDTAILGKHSVTALAGSSIGRSLSFMVSSIGLGVSSSLEAVASQALGAKEPYRAWAALSRTLVANLILYPFVVVILFFAWLSLPLFGVMPVVVDEAKWFLIGYAPGIYAFEAFIAVKVFLQAHGNIRPILISSLIANGINYIACQILVRGDKFLMEVHLEPLGLKTYGSFGVGLASSFASFLLFAICFLVAYRKRERPGPGERPPLSIKRILTIGLPVSLQLMAEIGVFSLVAVLAARFGESVAAAHQIALMLANFTFMGALGVSSAVAVQVGHAVGRGDSPRQEGLMGMWLGLLFMSLSALIFALFPRALVSLFTSDEPTIYLGVKLMHFASIFQLFDGLQVVATGALRGAGDFRYPFLANVCCHWGLGFPVAMLFGLGFGWGAEGLWLGLTTGLVAVSFVLSVRFMRLSKQLFSRIR